MGEARRAGPLAALSLLGAGAGWGIVAGMVAGAVFPIVAADSRSPADIPADVMLGLFFGSPTGLVLGLGLAVLPAVAIAFVTSPRAGRVAAMVAYLAMAAILVTMVLIDMESAPPLTYAALYVGALLFGLWRCQRSAAVAVERVEGRRAAPPVQRPGVPLEEPSL